MIAVLLCAIYLLGLATAAYSVLVLVEHDDEIALIRDTHPASFALFSAVVVVGWPAALLFAAWKHLQGRNS